MRSFFRLITAAVLLASSLYAHATVFATIHGVVHDPQHRPVAGARVLLKAVNSQFSLHTDTDSNGEFDLPEAPLGVFTLQVSASGFATMNETITLASGTNPVVHVVLPVASATETVAVEGDPALVGFGYTHDAH